MVELTLGQIFQRALLNTLLGMGTVFAVLVFISLLISLLMSAPITLTLLLSVFLFLPHARPHQGDKLLYRFLEAYAAGVQQHRICSRL